MDGSRDRAPLSDPADKDSKELVRNVNNIKDDRALKVHLEADEAEFQPESEHNQAETFLSTYTNDDNNISTDTNRPVYPRNGVYIFDPIVNGPVQYFGEAQDAAAALPSIYNGEYNEGYNGEYNEEFNGSHNGFYSGSYHGAYDRRYNREFYRGECNRFNAEYNPDYYGGYNGHVSTDRELNGDSNHDAIDTILTRLYFVDKNDHGENRTPQPQVRPQSIMKPEFPRQPAEKKNVSFCGCVYDKRPTCGIPQHSNDEVRTYFGADFDSGRYPSNYNSSVTQLDVTPLKEIALCGDNPNEWFIVTDMDTLIKEFKFLNVLVDSDEGSHLMIPGRVMSDLQAYIERSNNMAARRVMRLITHQIKIGYAYVAEEPAIAKNHNNTVVILSTCLELMKENYHLKSLSQVNMFTVEEIKELLSCGRNVLNNSAFFRSTKCKQFRPKRTLADTARFQRRNQEVSSPLTKTPTTTQFMYELLDEIKNAVSLESRYAEIKNTLERCNREIRSYYTPHGYTNSSCCLDQNCVHETNSEFNFYSELSGLTDIDTGALSALFEANFIPSNNEAQTDASLIDGDGSSPPEIVIIPKTSLKEFVVLAKKAKAIDAPIVSDEVLMRLEARLPFVIELPKPPQPEPINVLEIKPVPPKPEEVKTVKTVRPPPVEEDPEETKTNMRIIREISGKMATKLLRMLKKCRDDIGEDRITRVVRKILIAAELAVDAFGPAKYTRVMEIEKSTRALFEGGLATLGTRIKLFYKLDCQLERFIAMCRADSVKNMEPVYHSCNPVKMSDLLAEKYGLPTLDVYQRRLDLLFLLMNKRTARRNITKFNRIPHIYRDYQIMFFSPVRLTRYILIASGILHVSAMRIREQNRIIQAGADFTIEGSVEEEFTQTIYRSEEWVKNFVNYCAYIDRPSCDYTHDMAPKTLSESTGLVLPDVREFHTKVYDLAINKSPEIRYALLQISRFYAAVLDEEGRLKRFPNLVFIHFCSYFLFVVEAVRMTRTSEQELASAEQWFTNCFDRMPPFVSVLTVALRDMLRKHWTNPMMLMDAVDSLEDALCGTEDIGPDADAPEGVVVVAPAAGTSAKNKKRNRRKRLHTLIAIQAAKEAAEAAAVAAESAAAEANNANNEYTHENKKPSENDSNGSKTEEPKEAPTDVNNAGKTQVESQADSVQKNEQTDASVASSAQSNETEISAATSAAPSSPPVAAVVPVVKSQKDEEEPEHSVRIKTRRSYGEIVKNDNYNIKKQPKHQTVQKSGKGKPVTVKSSKKKCNNPKPSRKPSHLQKCPKASNAASSSSMTRMERYFAPKIVQSKPKNTIRSPAASGSGASSSKVAEVKPVKAPATTASGETTRKNIQMKPIKEEERQSEAASLVVSESDANTDEDDQIMLSFKFMLDLYLKDHREKLDDINLFCRDAYIKMTAKPIAKEIVAELLLESEQVYAELTKVNGDITSAVEESEIGDITEEDDVMQNEEVDWAQIECVTVDEYWRMVVCCRKRIADLEAQLDDIMTKLTN